MKRIQECLLALLGGICRVSHIRVDTYVCTYIHACMKACIGGVDS